MRRRGRTVSHVLSGVLTVLGTGEVNEREVSVELGWRQADPAAVTMVINGITSSTWHLDRQMLTFGLTERQGIPGGDVAVYPVGVDVEVEIGPVEDSRISIALDADDLLDFLHDTIAVAALNVESPWPDYVPVELVKEQQQ